MKTHHRKENETVNLHKFIVTRGITQGIEENAMSHAIKKDRGFKEARECQCYC